MAYIQIQNLSAENQIIDLPQEDLLTKYGGLEKKNLVIEVIDPNVLPEKSTNVRVIWAH